MTDEQIEKAKEWCKHNNCYVNNGFRKESCPLDCYIGDREICEQFFELYDRLKAENTEAKELCKKKIGDLKVNEWIKIMKLAGYEVNAVSQQELIEQINKEGLQLYEMQMKNGEIDMTFSSEGCDAFVYSILQMFKQNGGENFVSTTIEVDGQELGGRYALTIQKVGGITPIQKARQDTARELLQEYSEMLIAEFTESGNVECNTTVAKVLRKICPEKVNKIKQQYAQKIGVEVD